MINWAQIDQILQALQVARNFDTGIPTDAHQVRENSLHFLTLYKSATPDQQALLRARLTLTHALIPPNCVQAVRDNNPLHIQLALLALALSPDQDHRNNILALGPLYHCAKKLNIDTNALFQDAATHANSDTRQLILGFLKSGSKNLHDYGLDEVDGPDGYEIYSNDPWTRKQLEKYKLKP